MSSTPIMRAERAAACLESIAVEAANGAFCGILDFDPSGRAPLGTATDVCNFVNTSVASSRYVLGGIYRFGNKRFRYVQFKDAVAYALGQPVFFNGDTPFSDGVVTNDVSEAASATKPQVAGVCLGVQTADYYGFIQTYGRGVVLHNNDDDAAIGDPIIATVADTGVCNVGTWSITLGVGIGEVAVVAGTNLQQAFITVGSDVRA